MKSERHFVGLKGLRQKCGWLRAEVNCRGSGEVTRFKRISRACILASLLAKRHDFKYWECKGLMYTQAGLALRFNPVK